MPHRPPTLSRQYQDITLGTSSSSSSSTFNYNEHILNARQEETEGTLLHRSNINNEFHSLLAPATSQEECNSPDSTLLHITAFRARRTLGPNAKPRREELVETQFPQVNYTSWQKDFIGIHFLLAKYPELDIFSCILEQFVVDCYYLLNSPESIPYSYTLLYGEHYSLLMMIL